MNFQESLQFVSLSIAVIFFLTGSALVSIGIIYHLTFTDLDPVLDRLHAIPKLTIAAGATNLICAQIGTVAAILKNRRLLFFYTALLITACIFQASVASYIAAQDYAALSDRLTNTINTVFHSPNGTDFVNLVQSELRCCGVDGPGFWNDTMYMPFPETCCGDDECMYMHNDGCKNAIVDLLVEAVMVMGVSLITISTTEIVGALLAAVMAKEVNKATKNYEQAMSEESE